MTSTESKIHGTEKFPRGTYNVIIRFGAKSTAVPLAEPVMVQTTAVSTTRGKPTSRHCSRPSDGFLLSTSGIASKARSCELGTTLGAPPVPHRLHVMRGPSFDHGYPEAAYRAGSLRYAEHDCGMCIALRRWRGPRQAILPGSQAATSVLIAVAAKSSKAIRHTRHRRLLSIFHLDPIAGAGPIAPLLMF